MQPKVANQTRQKTKAEAKQKQSRNNVRIKATFKSGFLPVSCFLPAATTQRKAQRCKAKETSGASRVSSKAGDPVYQKEHDPASLARCFCFILPRSLHPANLARSSRAVLLIKRGTFLLFPSSCLFEFKAKAKEQRSKIKRTRLSLCICSVCCFQSANAHERTQSNTKREICD